MRRIALPLTLALLLVLSTMNLAAARRRAVPHPSTDRFCDIGTDIGDISVPPGFCIRKFADVPRPRALLFAPNGDLFVSSPSLFTPSGAPPGADAIFVFREPIAGDPPLRFTYAAGITYNSVQGLLIRGNELFYTLDGGVFSVPFVLGGTQMSAGAVRIADLPSIGQYPVARWTHSLALSADGSLLVSDGEGDNDNCPPPTVRLGSVLRIGPGHSFQGDIVADGFRDPLFIRCMPWAACYTIELSGDKWENLGGHEKLIELHDGDHYGYPCCIDVNAPNPNVQPPPDCSQIVASKSTFPLHSTPFGFDWEREFGWPEPYRHGFFVGLHGHFAYPWPGTGLQWAPTDPVTHLPTKPTVDFATGFGGTASISRVGDVAFAPDGRLFFADDQGGAIYWIAPRTLLRPLTQQVPR